MKKIIPFILVMLMGACGNYLSAQESRYKALYLFNFTKYIDWSGENITIGVIGNSPVLLELEALASQNHKINLIKISGSEYVDDCDIIFLPSAQTRNFELIQEKIGSNSTILIAEDENLITRGAEMAFYMEGGKLKFTVNKSELEATGLKMSSSLMIQAKVVN
ncbi:MAG: YfiR family protein [Cyclobacteriaceae bacterium]